MPKYGGTLPKVIAIHIRPLHIKVQKEGVWEDTQMLKLTSGDCASGVGLVDENHTQIRLNFAKTHCKSQRAPISKSGVWEDTRMLSGEIASGTASVGREMLSSYPL